jgi:hypothetical protein
VQPVEKDDPRSLQLSCTDLQFSRDSSNFTEFGKGFLNPLV